MDAVVYDKKKLIIIRALLIAIGAGVGATAMWQYFVYYPESVKREIQIVIIVVSGAAFAAILGLSAKPFYRLGAAVIGLFANVGSTLGRRGIIAVLAGLAAAGLAGFLFDVILRSFLDIIAVRVLADALVTVFFAAVCCYGFSKWLTADDVPETSTVRTSCHGYLLTASCFFDDRVFAAADFLCDVKVSTAALKAVWKFGDVAALTRLKAVTESGAVETVKCVTAFEEKSEYAAIERRIADKKLLVLLQTANDIFEPFADGETLDVFAMPTAGLVEKYMLDAKTTVQADAPASDTV